MPINVKCSCGNQMSVPDGTAAHEAFCPVCRKKVPIPAATLDIGPAPADSREASEFRPGALAQLLGSSAPAGSPAPAQTPGKPKPPSGEPITVAPKDSKPAAPEAPKPAAAPAPSTAPAAPAVPEGPRVEVFPDKVKFHCECGQKVAVRLPAPKTAGKCPKCGRSLRVPELPGTSHGDDKRSTKERTICRKCGRRIEDSGAAFCPRCGTPLAIYQSPAYPVPTAEPAAPASKDAQNLPPAAPAPAISVTPAAKPPEPTVSPAPVPMPAASEPQEEPGELRRRSARQAAEAAAELLRPSTAMRGFVEEPPAPAGIVRRLLAALIDLVAAAAVGVVAIRMSPDMAPWLAGLIGAGAFLLVNEVVFASMAGARSLGMVVCNVAVFGSSGTPAGAVVLALRLLSWPVLAIGSPLALFNPQRRALHDLLCGTTIRQLAKG